MFFIGVLVIFNAFLSSKLPGMCGIFNYIICGLILFMLTLSDRFSPTFANACRLTYQDFGSDTSSHVKRFVLFGCF